MLKILHCGDIHLDSPFSLLDREEGSRRRDELRRTFLEMLQFARREEVALVLISGDLFDHGFATADTLKLLCDAFSAMEDCHFVITPGNHDAAIAGSAYLSSCFPPNVKIFTDETLDYIDYDDLGLRIWGYGFTADRLEQSPLAAYLATGGKLTAEGKTALLCGHADLGAPLSKYAPISGSDLAASGLCYAALGHTHNPPEPQRFGDTLAAYCGCLVGRSYDEIGFGGAILLSLEDGKIADWQRIPLARRQYRIDDVEVEGAASDADVIAAVKDHLARAGYGEETALRIRITGATDPAYTPDLDAVCTACRGSLWQFEMQDHTLPVWGSDYLARDPSIRGALYRTLLPAMQNGSPEERSRATAALRLGLAALEGRL